MTYLTTVHASTKCLGLEAFHASHRDRLPHVRTLYRWHRSWGERLTYFPTFSLEQLGLVHLHLFITRPDPRWARWPYAVESLWLSQNLVDPVLYLHCLVPVCHRALIEEFLRKVPLPAVSIELVWSGNSWQRLQLGDHETLSEGFPVYTLPTEAQETVPKEWRLAIPLIAEGWNERLSLPALWERVQVRLGTNVRAYVPSRRLYAVNGKRHVRDAYRALVRDGVFRQYLIRYHDECSLFVRTSSYQRALPDAVCEATRLAELFPAGSGEGLWRLHGSYELLRSRFALHGYAVFIVEHEPAPVVRFCYEWLFDARAGTWQFSGDRLRAYLVSP